jgi:hypothetical protein
MPRSRTLHEAMNCALCVVMNIKPTQCRETAVSVSYSFLILFIKYRGIQLHQPPFPSISEQMSRFSSVQLDALDAIPAS